MTSTGTEAAGAVHQALLAGTRHCVTQFRRLQDAGCFLIASLLWMQMLTQCERSENQSKITNTVFVEGLEPELPNTGVRRLVRPKARISSPAANNGARSNGPSDEGVEGYRGGGGQLKNRQVITSDGSGHGRRGMRACRMSLKE